MKLDNKQEFLAGIATVILSVISFAVWTFLVEVLHVWIVFRLFIYILFLVMFCASVISILLGVGCCGKYREQLKKLLKFFTSILLFISELIRIPYLYIYGLLWGPVFCMILFGGGCLIYVKIMGGVIQNKLALIYLLEFLCLLSVWFMQYLAASDTYKPKFIAQTIDYFLPQKSMNGGLWDKLNVKRLMWRQCDQITYTLYFILLFIGSIGSIYGKEGGVHFRLIESSMLIYIAFSTIVRLRQEK